MLGINSKYMLKISAQRIIKFRNESNCVDKSETRNLGYDQGACTASCLDKVVVSAGVNRTSFTIPRHPEEMLNTPTYTHLSLLVAEVKMKFGKNASIDYVSRFKETYNISLPRMWNLSGNGTSEQKEDQEAECYKKCLPPCDMTTYDVSIYYHGGDSHAAQSTNESTLQLHVTHASASQGGTITWQEIETTTFSLSG